MLSEKRKMQIEEELGRKGNCIHLKCLNGEKVINCIRSLVYMHGEDQIVDFMDTLKTKDETSFALEIAKKKGYLIVK